MIQWAEGVDIDPHSPLMPVIKRSVTHDEKNSLLSGWSRRLKLEQSASACRGPSSTGGNGRDDTVSRGCQWCVKPAPGAGYRALCYAR